MKAKGYTLIELVMVIALVGIVAAIGAPALLETGDAWSLASRFQDFAVQSAIVATNRMSREMRQLRNDTSVTTATSPQFTFVDVNNNTITYNRLGNTLMRNSDGLTDNVTVLTFTYYDDNGNTITSPTVSPGYTNIRRIRVDFSILAGTRTLDFQFQVRPQNLKRLNEKFK